MALKRLVKKFVRYPEVGPADSVYGLLEINKFSLRGTLEDSDGADHGQMALSGGLPAIEVVDKEKFRLYLAGETDGGFFSRIEDGNPFDVLRNKNLQPRWRGCNEVAYGYRCSMMGKFVGHLYRNDNSSEKPGKDFHIIKDYQ